MIFAADGSGNSLGVRFHVPDNTLRCGDSGAGAGAGIAVTTDTWYRVDLKLTYNTTCTVDMQVNGTSATQYTRAGSAAAIPNCYFGVMTLLLGPTADVFIDDLIVSGTSGDYPIGPGGVVGLYPNGDKTNSAATPTDGNGGHLYSAVTDFGKGSGGGTNLAAQNSESTSWQSLAKPLSTSIATNFIADATGASTEHLVWTLEDLPANAASVNGVMLVAATHSATNTTNNQSMKIKDASNNTSNAWNLLDLSENTITVPVFTFTAAPGGGAWSVSEVNGCLIQWGDSSDVNPDPYLDGVCLEVDYVPTPPRPGYNNGRNQTIAKPSLPSLIYGSAR